jgi:hypothetical protein
MRHCSDTPTPLGICNVARALCRHFGNGALLDTVAPLQVLP